MNSEDFKCNTCGDYVGEDGVWGLCDPCFDKEGGNEQLGKSKMQYAVEIVKPRVFDPPMKIKIVKAILSKQTPPK